MSILIEVAAGTVDDAVAAREGGADRVELNGGLELGGLTPSVGTVRLVREAAGLPVIAMLRPRAGGFVYSPRELLTIQRDADLLVADGVAGVAFGFLNSDRTIDVHATRKLVRQLGGKVETVFHRAFDVTPDPLAALETLVDLGVTRVLTSGQARTAAAGAELIRKLVARARGRIEILPGSGITAVNVRSIVEQTGARQVHGSFSKTKQDFAGVVCDATYRATSAALIRATREALRDVTMEE
jgi:copper homeostasis protein